MIAEHTAVRASVVALAAKLGVKAEDSPTSDSLKKGAVDVFAKLRTLKGKAFDKFTSTPRPGIHTAVTDALESVNQRAPHCIGLMTRFGSATYSPGGHPLSHVIFLHNSPSLSPM